MSFEASKAMVRAVVPRSVRNSFRSPAKLAEWLWDSAAYSLGNTRTLEIMPQWSIRCHPEAYRVFLESQVADGSQRQEFLQFASHCSPGMLLFDIGAHFGIFSLAAAHFGGRAVAVDPSRSAIRMIATEAALNQMESRIQMVCAAVSHQSGSLPMLTSGLYSHGYMRFTAHRPDREQTLIEAVSIDDLAQQFGSPTHIKVDVEGYEFAVIQGARQTLRFSRPTLFLELHNQIVRSEGLDPAAILDELDALGYRNLGPDGFPIERKAILERLIIRIVSQPRTPDQADSKAFRC